MTSCGAFVLLLPLRITGVVSLSHQSTAWPTRSLARNGGPSWAELAARVRFARRDVPISLVQTDPALYRRLRELVTRFFLLGGDVFSLRALEQKAREDSLLSCEAERAH